MGKSSTHESIQQSRESFAGTFSQPCHTIELQLGYFVEDLRATRL